MHFSLIPINIDSTSAVFTSDKNKIGYVFKHFVLSFYGDNDLQNFWSLLLFHVSQILEGDPKKFIGLFKKGYGYKMVFRRHYQHGMSMISRKKNVEDSVLSDQLSLNKKFCTKVLGHHTYNIDQTQIQKINTNLKFELISYVKRTVINPANHCGLNSCFSYDILVGGVKKSYSFRVGHNLTRSINPENSVTNECIPVYPLGINEGQMQYITQNMSIFPPIPTSCFVSNGLSIISNVR